MMMMMMKRRKRRRMRMRRRLVGLSQGSGDPGTSRQAGGKAGVVGSYMAIHPHVNTQHFPRYPMTCSPPTMTLK